MKSHLVKFLVTVFCALNLLAVSLPSQANHHRDGRHWRGGDGYHHRHCHRQPGFWRHGYWHEGRVACWRRW